MDGRSWWRRRKRGSVSSSRCSHSYGIRYALGVGANGDSRVCPVMLFAKGKGAMPLRGTVVAGSTGRHSSGLCPTRRMRRH